MTPTQEAAVAYALQNEGGWSDDPDDPGGATNFGVSLRFLRAEGIDIDGDGDVDADDVRALTKEQAGRLFLDKFWLSVFESLPPASAIRIFDHAVNAGPKVAIVVLQRALRTIGNRLADDGNAGPLTRRAAMTAPSEIIFAVRSERAGFYRELVARKPQLAKFLTGWLIRSYA